MECLDPRGIAKQHAPTKKNCKIVSPEAAEALVFCAIASASTKHPLETTVDVEIVHLEEDRPTHVVSRGREMAE